MAYIYEDYCTNEKTADAMMKMYELGPEGRDKIGKKARAYVQSEFNLKDTIDRWDETLTDLIENWRKNKGNERTWKIKELKSS